jgi:hypothetical protein
MGEYKSPSEKQSAKATPAKKSQDNSNVGEADILDSRSSTFQLKKFQEAAQESGRGSGLNQLQTKSSNHTGTSRIAQLQRMSDERNSEQSAFIQKNENKTGIPDGLKSGMESVSGISLNDVTVHRNSDKPAQLQAHAYAQGTNIHLGPGQEKHLPHEAWHVVQQKQGRVQATTQGNGNVPINDNPSLEREATQMGQKALKESSSGSSKLKNATVSPNATAQLMTKEEELKVAKISQTTARPMNKIMKQTVGNQLQVNDQLKNFDKSTLRKTAAPVPVAEPKKKEGFDQAGFDEAEKKREALDAQKVYPEPFKPSPKVKKAPKVEDNSTAATVASTPTSKVEPIPASNSGKTNKVVINDLKTNERMAAVNGANANIRATAGDLAEEEKHGDATFVDKKVNSAKSVAANTGAKLVTGAKDAKENVISTGSGILGGVKSIPSKIQGGLSSIKEGASSMWSKTKSFFGGKPKGEPEPAEPVRADEPSFMKKMGSKALNVIGKGAVGAAKSVANVVAKPLDIFGNLFRTGKSAKDAYDAHGIKTEREDAIKGQEGSKQDFSSNLAGNVRNSHLMEGAGSALEAGKGGLSVAKKVMTMGADGVFEESAGAIMDQFGDHLQGEAQSGGIAAAGKALVGGKPEQKAISNMGDMTLGETLAGQSQTETENLANYQSIVAGKKGELSEEEKAAAKKSQSGLFAEAFKRGAAHNDFTDANIAENKAQSMDTSTTGEKYDLHTQSIEKRKNAEQHREAVNEGTATLKPSDMKSRAKDMNLFKKLGDRMKDSDQAGTEKLIENEDQSHNRLQLPTEFVSEKANQANNLVDNFTEDMLKPKKIK